MRVYTFDRLEVTLSELLSCHFDGLPVRRNLLKRYSAVLEHANSLLKPLAGVELITNYMFNEMMRSVKSVSPTTFQKLLPLQQSAAAAYLSFCTIGSPLDTEVELSSCGENISTAFIIDAVGSIAVVKFSKYVEQLMHNEAASQGRQCSCPIMPGTMGIDVAVNRLLCDMVDVGQIGISLTKNCIMKPLKTLSLIVGIGNSQLEIGSAGHDCSRCESSTSCYMKYIREGIDKSPIPDDVVNTLRLRTGTED
jgi:hypothetical protein